MRSSLIFAAVTLLWIVPGGDSHLLAGERLLGCYESDEERVIWECSDVFVGSFTNVGEPIDWRPAVELCYGAKVQVTQALKGSLKGGLGAGYSRQDWPEDQTEDMPVKGRAYVMFANQESAKGVMIEKLLPATETNVARITAYLGKSTPLGDAVRTFIGEDYSRHGKPGMERHAAVEKMIVDHAAEANQLVMHEILSDPKYRATLEDLRITELLCKTAESDPAGSRQAAQIFYVRLDEERKTSGATRNFEWFIRSLSEQASYRAKAERQILQAKKPDPYPELSKLAGQMVILQGNLSREDFGWAFTCPMGRLYLYKSHQFVSQPPPYGDVRDATLLKLSAYPVRITGVVEHQPADWDNPRIGLREEHYMMHLDGVKVVPVPPKTGPTGK